MKNYEKPIVMINEDMAEGVYAASGDCYTFTADIMQGPDRPAYYDNYVIQINGTHNATDGHHSGVRTVKIVFNQDVTYLSSNAESCTGSGSKTLYLTYTQYNGSYHNNEGGNIGLGNLNVDSAHGLAITGVTCTYCNESCEGYGHTW